MSSDQEKDNPDLLKYLIRNGHWSPFEHVTATWEIRTSRAIAQQILRHRSFVFQEFSQRYATVSSSETYEARAKGSSNRQGSLDNLPHDVKFWFKTAQEEVRSLSTELYGRALSLGVAPESARFLLPQSTSTKLYMTGSLRSWIHYLSNGPGGRCNPHTQKEHRDIALSIRATFSSQFPIVTEALEALNWLEVKDD